MPSGKDADRQNPRRARDPGQSLWLALNSNTLKLLLEMNRSQGQGSGELTSLRLCVRVL